MKQKYYTKEFKEQAVKLALSDLAEGEKMATTAKNLGVSLSSICKWVKEFKENGNESFPGKGKMLPQDEEIHKLRKALNRAEMERDILKKAISFFTQNQ